MPVAEFDPLMSVDLRAVFLGLQAVLRQMIAQGRDCSISKTAVSWMDGAVAKDTALRNTCRFGPFKVAAARAALDHTSAVSRSPGTYQT